MGDSCFKPRSGDILVANYDQQAIKPRSGDILVDKNQNVSYIPFGNYGLTVTIMSVLRTF
jgi:hypothetical protein